VQRIENFSRVVKVGTAKPAFEEYTFDRYASFQAQRVDGLLGDFKRKSLLR
jgi:hypothetical protein